MVINNDNSGTAFGPPIPQHMFEFMYVSQMVSSGKIKHLKIGANGLDWMTSKMGVEDGKRQGKVMPSADRIQEISYRMISFGMLAPK